MAALAVAGVSAVAGSASGRAARPDGTRAVRSYGDRRGEDAGAADVTAVVLTSNASDDVAFAVSVANMPELADDAQLFIALDLDRNVGTGDRDGVDVLFQLDRAGAKLERWEGARFAAFEHPPFAAGYSGGRLTATLPVGRLGSRVGFDFGVVSVRGAGAASHVDAAPDSGRWTFAFHATPAAARSLTATFAPAAPIAGRQFAVRRASLVLANGKRRAAAMRCAAAVDGKRLVARRTCSWLVPATARGRLLVVTVTGSSAEFRLTRMFRLRIR